MSAVPLLRFRPLTRRPPNEGRKASPFRATYSDTEALLRDELRMLGARDAVIEVDLDERDIRRDGLPYARSSPRSPAVAVSFVGRWGPMRLACDRFTDWRHNLRAIALGLGDLRRIDRYGLGRSGEQYVGWVQIGAGSSSTVQRGRELIRRHGGIRAAQLATHPDRGGRTEEFLAVQAAASALEREE